MNRFPQVFIVLLLFSSSVLAQLSDIARIDFSILPKGNATFEYSRTRALFNYPIKLNKKASFLIIGVDYSNINLSIDDIPKVISNELREFQIFDVKVGYTSKMKNDWRFGISFGTGVSSNLTAKELSTEDIVLSGAVIFMKEKNNIKNFKKSYKLLVGISYSGNRGFPYPLPFINYYRKFHSHWSYDLGIPKTNLQYHFSEEHKLKLYAALDGFTTNIQRGFLIENQQLAQSINMSLILSGFRYEYHFADHFQLFMDASYVLSQEIALRNEAKNTIRSLTNENQFYFSGGFRFKF